MALMLGQLYDALRAGNVPDDKARAAAAEEVASYRGGWTQFRVETGDFFDEMAECLGRIDSDLRVLKWMTGFLLALTIGTFAMEWQILLRLPPS
jgi:hypothetical protein